MKERKWCVVFHCLPCGHHSGFVFRHATAILSLFLLQVTREGFCIIACMYARGELILPLEDALESDDIAFNRQQEFQQANILKKVADNVCTYALLAN